MFYYQNKHVILALSYLCLQVQFRTVGTHTLYVDTQSAVGLSCCIPCISSGKNETQFQLEAAVALRHANPWRLLLKHEGLVAFTITTTENVRKEGRKKADL